MKIWQIKLHSHQKSHQLQIVDSSSDKDMASLISFTPIRLSTSSSRIKPDHDLDTGSEEDMANQSSFTSKRLSTPNSTSS